MGILVQETRQTLLKSYYDEQAALDSVKAELAKFSSGDPAIYEQKKLDIELMKESALRWTGDYAFTAFLFSFSR